MCGPGIEYRSISCHEVNNNGYLMKNNYSNQCDPYRAPTTRISCNMGDCESPYLWHVEPWSKVNYFNLVCCLFMKVFCSVHRIVIEVNKYDMFIVKIDNHLYRLMIVFVFRINLLYVLIVMDLVSYFKIVLDFIINFIFSI